MLISVNQSSKCSSLQYAPHQIFHNKCKVLSSFKGVTLQLQTDIGKGVILTLSVLQDHSPAVRNGCPSRDKPCWWLVLLYSIHVVVMLKNRFWSITMKFIVWIINAIHVKFNDIHWEGCLHIRRRCRTPFRTSRYVQTSLPMNIIKYYQTRHNIQLMSAMTPFLSVHFLVIPPWTIIAHMSVMKWCILTWPYQSLSAGSPPTKGFVLTGNYGVLFV